MLSQICLYLLSAFVGSTLAICIDKYLSLRKQKSIPGYKLIKSIENREAYWLSDIVDRLDNSIAKFNAIEKKFREQDKQFAEDRKKHLYYDPKFDKD